MQRFETGSRQYVATPYTDYPDHDWAWRDACRACAALRRQFPGVTFYSPIAETHGIIAIGALNLKHAEWLAADKAHADVSDGLVVVKLPGWHKSNGVDQEITWFLETGKPVVYAVPVISDDQAAADDHTDPTHFALKHAGFVEELLYHRPSFCLDAMTEAVCAPPRTAQEAA
jgi:hypothetical protein